MRVCDVCVRECVYAFVRMRVPMRVSVQACGYARCACNTLQMSRVCMRVFGVLTEREREIKALPEEAYLVHSHTCTHTHTHTHVHTRTHTHTQGRRRIRCIHARVHTQPHTHTHTHTHTQVKLSRQEAFQELGLSLSLSVSSLSLSPRGVSGVKSPPPPLLLFSKVLYLVT